MRIGGTGHVNGRGTTAQFAGVQGMVADQRGIVWIADGRKIRQLTADGMVMTIAGDGTDDTRDGLGTAAAIKGAVGLAFNADESVLYFTQKHCVRQLVIASRIATASS